MMPSQPIADRLKTHLSRVGADIVHAASTRVPPDGLNILIDRAPLSFPIGEDDIAALISIAEPAHFGSGEDTVFDPTVRDTWVIDPAHVHLGDPTGAAGTDNWTGALNESLGCLSAALGIPADATVRAELHSMLVYGEGQFFLPHQDSEKDDSMLATLVVGLPTTHTGGELVVDDHGADRIFTGDPNDITLAAFYADRRHEVKPVTSGHRVTLTFNLLVDHPAAEDTTDDDHTMTATAADDAGTGDPVDSELRALITEYFTTPVKPRWGGGNATPPQRMVFLLDHEYSRHGLSRTTLKGGDRLRAACLLSAARSAGCEAMLGLSEIHETREAAIDDRGGYYGNRCGRYWDDENEPDIETFDTDGELLDGVITLNWWMVPDKGIGESIESRVGEEETLAVTSTRQLTAHAAEYEGYMGNYGNTVDHWYRRAAIILWPMESSFVVRAEAGSGWALRTLADRLTQGQIAEAAADARSLEPFWSGAGPESLDLALEVALGVEDRTAATVVLTPYGIAGLGAEQAEALGALTERYGTTWLRDLLGSWASSGPRFTSPGVRALIEWVNTSMASTIAVLRTGESPSGATVAEVLISHAAAFIPQQVASAARQMPPAQAWRSLADLGGFVAEVVSAATRDHAAAIVDGLDGLGGDLIPFYVSVLQSAADPADENFAPIVAECRRRLEAEIAKPERAADDWSIPFSGCGCADCDHLAGFLASSEQQSLTWPLAKPRRQHIHSAIDAQGLPVTHTTERTGSPHKLKLHKTDLLMKEDAARRKYCAEQLAWVRGLNR